jgi:hypothetical protein
MEQDERKEDHVDQHSEERTEQESFEHEQQLHKSNAEAGQLETNQAQLLPEYPVTGSMDDSLTNSIEDYSEELESSEPEAEPAQLSEMELNELIENICTSKAEEFRMIGYEHVTGKEIWECVSDKYQKTGMPALHQIVNDILSLKVTKFMNWMTMSIYKSNPFA